MKKKLDKIKRGFIQFLIAGFILQVSGLMGLLGIQSAQAAALAEHIVISEAQAGGGTAGDEFVELYNPTDSAVTMIDWRLTRKTSTGTESNLVSDLDGTVPANGFFLIAPSGDYDGAISADVNYSTIQRIAADNTIVLYSDAGITMVDKVGMGATQDREGAATDNPLDNGSIERRPGAEYSSQGNGIDTNDNGDDFEKRVISDPQNSTSAIEDPNAPAAPAGLTVTDVPNDEGGALKLSWVKSIDDGAGKDNVTSYNVFRKIDGAVNFTQIISVAKGVENYTDATAVTGTKYVYRVEAVDGAYSAFSAESIPTISIDDLAPRISAQTPADQAIVAGAKPTISAQFTETGSGIDTASILLKVDGTDVTAQATKDAAGISYTPLLNITEGVHQVELAVADKAVSPNSSSSQWMFTVDTVAPVVTTLAVNSGANYTKTRNIAIKTKVSSDTTQMRLSENNSFVNVPWLAYAGQTNFTLSEGYGSKTVYFQLKDAAGNLSDIYSGSITYIGGLANENINSPVTGTFSASQMVDAKEKYNAELYVSSKLAGTTFASIATYKQNPGKNLPADIVGIGSFLDFSIEESGALPANIRIYYTAQDLSRAGVTDTGQLLGLYYWDGKEWRAYGQTGVVDEGYNGYQGYVWATVDHLTPVIIAADIAAPNNGIQVQNLNAQVGDGKVELTWDKAEDATAYLVQYKKTNETDWNMVLLSGGDIASTAIVGLTNDTEYQFGISARDRVGNLTPLVTVSATPKGAEIVPVKVVLAVNKATKSESAVVKEEAPKQISVLPKEEKEESVKEIKGEEGEKEIEVGRGDRRRLIVALVILVVAIAAGIGGYYGYEWWVSQPEKEPTKSTRKKKRSNGRW